MKKKKPAPKLLINSVQHPNDINKEAIIIHVLGDVNLSHYVLILTSIGGDGQPAHGVRLSYWFPPKTVKREDWIFLYTRSGKPISKGNRNSTITHNFYMGYDQPLYAPNLNNCVVLMDTKNLNRKKLIFEN